MRTLAILALCLGSHTALFARKVNSRRVRWRERRSQARREDPAKPVLQAGGSSRLFVPIHDSAAAAMLISEVEPWKQIAWSKTALPGATGAYRRRHAELAATSVLPMIPRVGARRVYRRSGDDRLSPRRREHCRKHHQSPRVAPGKPCPIPFGGMPGECRRLAIGRTRRYHLVQVDGGLPMKTPPPAADALPIDHSGGHFSFAAMNLRCP